MTVKFCELLFQRVLPFGEINQAMHITFVCYFFPELLTWNSGRWMPSLVNSIDKLLFLHHIAFDWKENKKKGNEICNNPDDFFVYVWIHSQLYSWFKKGGIVFCQWSSETKEMSMWWPSQFWSLYIWCMYLGQISAWEMLIYA